MSAALSTPAAATACIEATPGSDRQPTAVPFSGAAAGGGEWPQPGEIWRGSYQVEALLGDQAVTRMWSAVRCDTREPVTLHAIAATDHARRAELWDILQGIEQPSLLRALARHDVGETHIEVSATPPALTLAAWRGQATPEDGVVEKLVRSLGAALMALHERGLVHCGVRSDQIFVREEAGAVEFVLGGWGNVAAFAQPGLVRMAVDPLTAPPEAAGLFQHSPGRGLCAWDWWSLGRVVQEFILGEHVFARVLRRDLTAPSPDLLARLEALLLERDANAPRAGAVEAMPPMSPRLETLLRGLLTSVREARWDGERVQRWLRGEPVRELYRLPRNERLFHWREGWHTVSDAAESLRTAEHWGEAVGQIWEKEKAGTLAHFITEVPALRERAERIDELRKIESAFALKTIPREAVREALTAVALLELAGDGRLVWSGCAFNEEALQKVFAGEPAAQRLALLEAFTARPVVMLIERSDSSAAHVLAEFAHVITGAETLARQLRWLTVLSERGPTGRALLLRTALWSLAALRAEATAMHERFACSTEAAVDKLFQLAQPSRPELAVLAWLGRDAVRRGFLTHVQWAEREHARLRAAAEAEAATLGWLHLRRALASGPWLFSRWRWLVPLWLLWAPVAAVLWPGPRWLVLAFAPVLVGVALRVAAMLALRRTVSRFHAAARPWRFRDGLGRCFEELGEYQAGRAPAEVRRALQDFNTQMAQLSALEPRPAPVPRPARCTGIWIFSIASWCVFFAGIAGPAWWAKRHRPSWQAIVLAWNPPKVEPPAGSLAASTETQKPVGPVKVSWPFKPGDVPTVVRVTATVEAEPAQLRYVNSRGPALVRPYKPETINTLIVLRVPTEGKIGLMVYDGVHRQLVNPKVFLIDYAPFAKEWIEVGELHGIYLPE